MSTNTPSRGRRASDPLLWSRAALAISVVALMLALTAALRSGGASHVAAAPTITPSADSASAAESAVGVPTDDPTGAPTGGSTDGSTDGLTDGATETVATESSTDDPISTVLPSAGAAYTMVNEKVHLRLPGGDTRYLDLDQPMVNPDGDASDASYYSDDARPYISFDNTAVAIARSPDVKPEECARNIQLAPADDDIVVSQDLVICAVSDGLGAVNAPNRPKMVKMVVDSVSESGNLNATLTAWELPR